ncbi:MAG: hypothetical protein AAB315_00985, partial [Pseudomonadota bacterium]
LYDAAGRELVPQLFGYTTPDFYLGYLEQAIAQAIRRVRPARTALVAPDILVSRDTGASLRGVALRFNAAGDCAPSAAPWRRAGG